MRIATCACARAGPARRGAVGLGVQEVGAGEYSAVPSTTAVILTHDVCMTGDWYVNFTWLDPGDGGSLVRHKLHEPAASALLELPFSIPMVRQSPLFPFTLADDKI